jgi:hypothetical protein
LLPVLTFHRPSSFCGKTKGSETFIGPDPSDCLDQPTRAGLDPLPTALPRLARVPAEYP